MRLHLFLPTLAVALSLTACGGGGGGNGSTSLRLETAFDRSGRLYDDGTYVNLPMSGNVVAPGDEASNRVERGLISIILAPIPSGATIDSATLNIQGYVAFGAPYAEFGSMVMDHIDVGPGLDAGDFSGALTAAYRTVPDFTGTSGAPTLVGLDVKSAIIADIAAGRLTSSFRFQFNLAPSIDAAFDIVFIDASPAVPLTLPHVIVTYH